jgi:hypothetical protein
MELNLNALDQIGLIVGYTCNPNPAEIGSSTNVPNTNIFSRDSQAVIEMISDLRT